MRQVVYSVAASLDGYISGPKGESDWIVMDPEIEFSAVFARFDTFLLGRKTYEATRGAGGEQARDEALCRLPDRAPAGNPRWAV